MTEQHILVLSFFDKVIPKEMSDNDLSSEMLRAGIGSDEGSRFPYYEIVHQLKTNGFLEQYRDLTKPKTGISRASGPELLILSNKALQILTEETINKKHQEYITELQFNKLSAEHDILNSQLADYNKTKQRGIWTFIIAIISILIAILALIKR